MIKLQAHRGVSTEAPENTLPAIELAAAQGYAIAEVDVSVTKDGKFVLLCDDTLNRTARQTDGSAIEQPLPLAQLTYEEALNYDFGGWFSKKYEGTPIPLFEDILKFARAAGIQIKLSDSVGRLTEAQQNELKAMRAAFDDVITEEENVVSTTGKIKPQLREGVLSDMHLHSQNSHDSQCPVIDMARAQAVNGIKLMAVTDHCDVGFSGVPELSRIEASYAEVQQTDALVEDLQILTGVEIGGSFLRPDLAETVAKHLPYDVIVGSVHAIVDPISKKPLGLHGSKEFSEANMYEYLGAYYDCMRILIDVLDCDILAHMTYPIRYLTGHFGYRVDLERLRDKIDDILQAIIRKGIALEINTSSYDLLNDTMPGRELVQRYFDMGGYLVTLGSDAHAADKANKAFSEAVTMLKEIGFENIYYYKGRKAYQCKLV